MPTQPQQPVKKQPSLVQRAVDWIEHEAEGLTPSGWAAHAMQQKAAPALAGNGKQKTKKTAKPFGPFSRIEGALTGGKPQQ